MDGLIRRIPTPFRLLIAPDPNLTGNHMGQLRTANKRHNRAIVANRAREKAAEAAAPAKAAPSTEVAS
ncbi:hypothetical protein [Sphingomonas sp. MMS24-J13]|uniref:hypothetical protein n=1 Tax=Sphingomonas sp. MMS24-J13 TaxID=3238686 RepID=UPI0038517984